MTSPREPFDNAANGGGGTAAKAVDSGVNERRNPPPASYDNEQ